MSNLTAEVAAAGKRVRGHSAMVRFLFLELPFEFRVRGRREECSRMEGE